MFGKTNRLGGPTQTWWKLCRRCWNKSVFEISGLPNRSTSNIIKRRNDKGVYCNVFKIISINACGWHAKSIRFNTGAVADIDLRDVNI